MKELVGALMDSGYSPQEVREMMGPLLAEEDEANDLGAHVHDPSGREEVLRDVLTMARDDRQPPGPTVVVPSGVVNSLPQAHHAKPVRVDTEDSYRAFRRSGQDLPEDAVEALSTAAEAELMGDFERGYASQWMVGNIMDMVPASQHALQNLSPHQTCVVCGAGGGVICAVCGDRLPELVGLFDRGYASQVIGFGERGAAASIHDDNPSATLDLEASDAEDEELREILGSDADEFYRLARGEGYSSGRSPLVGSDGFYRLPRHSMGAGGLTALIGDVMALAVPSTTHAEEVPLAFHRPSIHKHAVGWKQGGHLYGSIRVTGWDGEARILTTATPYAKELGCVVGYATSAAIPPTHMLAVADPLARRLGASRLFPRLAAAAPAVLRVAHGKIAPVLLSVMPAGSNTEGWV